MTDEDHGSADELGDLLESLGLRAEDLPPGPHDQAAVAADAVMSRGDQHSLTDLADSLERPVLQLQETVGHMGIQVDDPSAVMFSDRDRDLLVFVVGAIYGDNGDLTVAEGIEMLHVSGSALETIAEAAIASHVQGPERRNPDPAAALRLNVEVTELGLLLGEQMPAAFRHHLRQAVQRQRRTQSSEHPEQAHLAIGFIDLVGFTALSQRVSSERIVELVKEFEGRAHEVGHRHKARVAKLIGDEVMFSAESPAAAVDYACELMCTFRDDDVVPRGGIAAGEIITLHGDYFGPVVNLAARLVDEAVPGEILFSQTVAENAGVVVQPAGRRMIRGFEDPVPVWSFDPPNAVQV